MRIVLTLLMNKIPITIAFTIKNVKNIFSRGNIVKCLAMFTEHCNFVVR